VHSQRDLRLLAVAAERPFTDQQPYKDAAIKIRQRARPVSPPKKS
jgi:hypothetical protein